MLLSKKKSKSETKQTSAKTLAKTAVTLKTNIEFAIQPFMEDIKLKDQLEKIAQSFQITEKSMADKSKKDFSDLTKEFDKTESELNQVVKKIQSYQEYVSLAEKSLYEKLSSKINHTKEAKKDAKAQEEYKKQAEKMIGEIQSTLENAKKKMSFLVQKAEAVMKHHQQIKPKIAVFSLPENVTQSDKQAKKLKERLEDLCQASQEIDALGAQNLEIDKEKITNFLPQLQANIKSCGLLIDQTLINLKPLMIGKGLIQAGMNSGVSLGVSAAVSPGVSAMTNSSASHVTIHSLSANTEMATPTLPLAGALWSMATPNKAIVAATEASPINTNAMATSTSATSSSSTGSTASSSTSTTASSSSATVPATTSATVQASTSATTAAVHPNTSAIIHPSASTATSTGTSALSNLALALNGKVVPEALQGEAKNEQVFKKSSIS